MLCFCHFLMVQNLPVGTTSTATALAEGVVVRATTATWPSGWKITQLYFDDDI